MQSLAGTWEQEAPKKGTCGPAELGSAPPGSGNAPPGKPNTRLSGVLASAGLKGACSPEAHGWMVQEQTRKGALTACT